MAQGHIKQVQNLDSRFGSLSEYLHVKAQPEGRGGRSEEYWLVTPREAQQFSQFAASHPEEISRAGKGVFCRVPDASGTYWHIAVKVIMPDKTVANWVFTEHALEVLRSRAEKSPKTMEENKYGWLVSLFD
jgi:hypothetical protein